MPADPPAQPIAPDPSTLDAARLLVTGTTAVTGGVVTELVSEEVIPLLEERLRVGKRAIETGRVRVSISTEAEERIVRETLRHRHVDVERVTIGREVTEVPNSRQEGDTLIIPVLEEILVIERRLVLREEVRLRLHVEEEAVEQPMLLRTQHAAVERLPPETATVVETAAVVEPAAASSVQPTT